MENSKYNKYKRFFSEGKLWKKLSRSGKRLGKKAIYVSLLMFFSFKKKETPIWAKNVIMGTIGYLLLPLDGIPDLTPFLGYSDDMGVLMVGLATVSAFIDQGVKQSAAEKMEAWNMPMEAEDLKEIEAQL